MDPPFLEYFHMTGTIRLGDLLARNIIWILYQYNIYLKFKLIHRESHILRIIEKSIFQDFKYILYW
jgi:hypothetical protein